MLNVRVSPFGRGLYAGTGVTVLTTSETRLQERQPGRTEDYSTTAHVLLVGFEIPVGQAGVFGEAQGLKFLGWENSGAVLLAGVNIRLQ